MIKFLTPFIYTLFATAVVFEVVFLVSIIERIFGLHSVWGYMGDIDAVLSLLFFGGATLFLANIFISRCEETNGTIALNHLRQSVLLYLFLCLSSSTLFSLLKGLITEENFNPGLGGGVLTLAYIVAVYSVVINAVFLYFLGRSTNKSSLTAASKAESRS